MKDASKATKTLKVFPWDRIRLESKSKDSSSSKQSGAITADFYEDNSQLSDQNCTSTIIRMENMSSEESTKVILVARNLAPKDSEDLDNGRTNCGAYIEEITSREENGNESDTIIEWGPLLKPREKRSYKVTLNEEVSKASAAILFMYTYTEVYRVEILLNGANEQQLERIRQPPRPSAYLFEEVGQADHYPDSQDSAILRERESVVQNRAAATETPQVMTETLTSDASAELIQQLRQMLHPSKVPDGNHEGDISLHQWTDAQRRIVEKHQHSSLDPASYSATSVPNGASKGKKNSPVPKNTTSNQVQESNKLQTVSDEFFNCSDEEENIDRLGSIDMVRSDNEIDNLEAPQIDESSSKTTTQHAPSAAFATQVESARPPVPQLDTSRPTSAFSASATKTLSGRNGSRPTSASSPRRNDSSRQVSRQIVHSLEDTRIADYSEFEIVQQSGERGSKSKTSLKPEEWSSKGQQKPAYRNKLVRGGSSISTIRTLRQRTDDTKHTENNPRCEGSFLRKEWIKGDNDMGLDLDETEPNIEILNSNSCK